MSPVQIVRPILALAWMAIVVAWPSTAAAAAAGPGVNDTCLMCHADADAKGAAGNSIAVPADAFGASVHGKAGIKCNDCHTDASPQKIPHAEKLKPVNCANCHEAAVKEYTGTVHGKARSGGNAVAASCVDCHGKHDIRSAKDPESRTNHANIEKTCGKCHGNDTVVQKANLPGGNIVTQFHDSIHGKALQGAAQSAAPTCTNCHGSHSIRAKDDPASHTNRARIPETCGTCHKPVLAMFNKGMHGKMRQEGNLAAPGCNDCHSAHRIQQHEAPGFVTGVVEQCGNCHQEYLTSYRDTYHGQVTKLGYARMATCASCHGAHDILPASNPASKVSAQNRLQTCQECHPGAERAVRELRPAREPPRPRAQPVLLLRGEVHGVAADRRVRLLRPAHGPVVRTTRRRPLRSARPTEGTLMGTAYQTAAAGPGAVAAPAASRYYRRFTGTERVMHAFLMLSFVGCALSGLPLIFADKPWASVVAAALGGFRGAALIHRISAFVLIVVFVSHVFSVFRRAFVNRSLLSILWGPDSMVPQLQDGIDLWNNLKWFVGRGPRPTFDRWTYWEKFDYWAVFWGMFIIGGSGLLLWFPVFFAKVLPGWMFNIATLVHGEEALLAVGFIFTIHFFNGHLRPEKFPMDTVVFTGRIPEHELKEERAMEYARLQKAGELEAKVAPPPTTESLAFGWFVGGTALALGVITIVLIVYSVLF